MPAGKYDYLGQRFGKLTVVSVRRGAQAKWVCECECGGSIAVASSDLRTGKTRSCGCGRFDGLWAANAKKTQAVIGLKFGRLTVTSEAPGFKRSAVCLCECGALVTVTLTSLRTNKTQSCGCLQRERVAEANVGRIKHGHSAGTVAGKRVFSPAYRSWKSMLERCRNPNAPNYHLYGGRGIAVCDQWQGAEGFLQFLADVGERPEGRTLDRYPDKNGNYEPGNVRWATPLEQSRNRREMTAENKARQLANLAKGRESQTNR